MSTPLHDDELPIDLAVVARLVERDLPEYAHLPLRPLASTGSTNALFRLGDALLVRLPRQRGGSATIAKELRWVPVIAPALPVGVPRIVAVGEPGFGYPERWCVTRWLDGVVRDRGASGERGDGRRRHCGSCRVRRFRSRAQAGNAPGPD